MASSTAAASSFGRTTSRMGSIQSETIVHFLPSHCWTAASPLPSWFSQVTRSGRTRPLNPSSSRRFSVTFRFSMPHRTCSPVKGLLPNRVIARRIASVSSMALMIVRL